MSEQYLMMNEAPREPDVEAAKALRRDTFSVERPLSEPGTVSTKKTPTKGWCRCSCTEFLGTFSCCSVCLTSIILFVAVVLVANVVSGLLGSMSAKVLSVTKYDSTEFFSLTKTVYSVGGAKQEKWSLKIPEDLLNTTFVISDAIAEGDGSQFIAGMPGLAYSGIPLYFALDKDRTMIHVYEKQLKSRATNAEDHILLEHGATDTWLTSGPIASDDRATGTITVDITQLLKMNFLIPFQTWTGVVAGPRLSRVVDAACYPRNCRFRLEIQTSVGATIETYLALSLLPKVPMTSRQADKRIGYFETEFTDIGVHTKKSTANDNGENGEDYEVDKKYHLINKWNLTKSTDCDDTTKLCKPTKEVIYHIDPTIPKRWRSYMKRAVELWQPSFKALGYANTPRARLPEDADWPKDYDSGDIRYTSIRMGLMQNGATAIGPVTTDPRTGEIMDADISFPESWVSVFAGKYWPDMVSERSIVFVCFECFFLFFSLTHASRSEKMILFGSEQSFAHCTQKLIIILLSVSSLYFLSALHFLSVLPLCTCKDYLGAEETANSSRFIFQSAHPLTRASTPQKSQTPWWLWKRILSRSRSNNLSSDATLGSGPGRWAGAAHYHWRGINCCCRA